MKRHIMLISPMLHQGGFERVCVTTARLLAPYYNITIVIFDDANIAYDVSGLDVVNLNLGSRKGKLKKLWNVLRRASALRRKKRELQSIVSYSFGPTANYANCLSKTKDTKVIAGLRNYTDIENKRQTRLFLRYADQVISCSEQIDRVLRSDYGFVNGTVLYNPFDLAGIKAQADERVPSLPWDGDEQAFVLAAMGRIAPQKGFWHLIKAFSLIHREYPHTYLLILGAGHFESYAQLADVLGVGEAVSYEGLQTNPFAYVKRADLYVLTSENEGFPNALVEAMSLSLPVVSVDCESGPREILLDEKELANCPESLTEPFAGAYGILCPPVSKGENFDPGQIEDSERMFARAVCGLLRDPEEYDRYRARSFARAQNFRMETYRDKLLEIIGRLGSDSDGQGKDRIG